MTEAVAYLDRTGTFNFRAPPQAGFACGEYVLLIQGRNKLLAVIDDVSYEHLHDRAPRPGSANPHTVADLHAPSMVDAGFCTGQGHVVRPVEDEFARLTYEPQYYSGEFRMSLADAKVVGSYFDSCYEAKSPSFPVGCLRNILPPVIVRLLARGFNRPTGLFGQSGSGKSYALGKVIEELHLNSQVDIVILDPNGDYVHIGDAKRDVDEVNKGSPSRLIAEPEFLRYQRLIADKQGSFKVLTGSKLQIGSPISIGLLDLEPAELAALLQIDPIAEEPLYKSMRELLLRFVGKAPPHSMPAFMEYIDGAYLATRISNLGVDEQNIWQASEPALVDVLRDEKRKTVVVDLSGLTQLERLVVSSVVMKTLWALQEERKAASKPRATLLVIDEAHNVFPSALSSQAHGLTLELGTRMAGEGRKYGLYMLTSSQLPSKIHEHVLTQCGNLILMKMLSQTDLTALANSFSFVSESLLQLSKSFDTGEALIVGRIVPTPCLVHFEGRVSQEGGGDLPVEW